MSIYQILLESRIDDVKRRYPMFTPEDYEQMYKVDPSQSKKYLLWIAREFYEQTSNMKVPVNDKLVDGTRKALRKWEQFVNRITPEHIEEYNEHFSPRVLPPKGTEKDIYQYNLSQVMYLGEYFDTIPTKSDLRSVVKKQTKIIFDGNLNGHKVLIVEPLSYLASCHYGATTKWCTASRRTSGNFDAYFKSGELFYIIYNDTTPPIKYAIYFSEKGTEDVQIYDMTDKRLDNERFFESHPEIKMIFKDKFPKSFYDILSDYYYNGTYNEEELYEKIRQLHRYGEEGSDRGVYVKESTGGMIHFLFDTDDIIDLFVPDKVQDSYNASAIREALDGRSGYGQTFYSMDGSEAEEDFNNGYVFGYFDGDTWNKLLEYLKYVDYSGVNIIRKIQLAKKKKKERQSLNNLYEGLAEILSKPIHDDLVEDIVEDYREAMEEAHFTYGDDGIKEDIKSSFTSFLKNHAEKYDIKSYGSFDISIHDLLLWYQNGNDTPLSENDSKRVLYPWNILLKMVRDSDFELGEIYEYYYEGYDEEEFKDEFDPQSYINKAIDRVENDPDFKERYDRMESEIDKLSGANIFVGEVYSDPTFKFKLQIIEPDYSEERFEVIIQNTETNKTKRAFLTADRIINILRTNPLFDIIDEVYSIFSKINTN